MTSRISRRRPIAARSAELRAKQVRHWDAHGDFARAPDVPIKRMLRRSVLDLRYDVAKGGDVTLAVFSPRGAGEEVWAWQWGRPT